MTQTPLKRRPGPADGLEARSTLLDKREVCRRLGISDWTLTQWVKSNRFPKACVRPTEASHRWRLSVLLGWIEAKAREPHRAPRLRGKAARWHQPTRIPRERL